MTAAPTLEHHDLDLLREDLHAGRSCIATFTGPGGTSRLDLLGPKGADGNPTCLAAPVRTLRLWLPGLADGPAAVAVATRDFAASLQVLEDCARLHLHPPEHELLTAILRLVRGASAPRPARVPKMGDRLTQEGEPSLRAWSSCLTLGDLQAALLSAVA